MTAADRSISFLTCLVTVLLVLPVGVAFLAILYRKRPYGRKRLYKQTKSPRGGYLVLSLGAPRFHQADDNRASFDVAVCAILGMNRARLQSQGIESVDLRLTIPANNLRDGREITAWSFPAEYLEAYLALNNEKPLPIKKDEAIIRSVPIGKLMQRGFVANLREGFVGQTKDNRGLGKGSSGGLVLLRESSRLTPAGMVVGGVEADLTFGGKQKCAFGGFVFSALGRIEEAIG